MSSLSPRRASRPVAVLLAIALAMTVTVVGMQSADADEPYPYTATDYTEPYRGQFHFSSQSGWMNDINGPIWYRGQYHLFYQHNPHGLHWDTMHWGHATSPDLVRWTQQPIALEPELHPASGNRLFTGSGWVDYANHSGLKVNDHDPILLFTGTEGVSIAVSTDGAKSFQMYDDGAAVFTTPYESRDPKVVWDADAGHYVMALYAVNNGRVANFYTSPNLLNWTFAGEFRADWFHEVPDLYELPVDGNANNTRWVLQDAGGRYVIGDLNAQGVFVSEWSEPQVMDKATSSFTGSWYAGLVFPQLPDGRVVQMGWQPGNRGSTWTGNASFPVTMELKRFAEGIRIVRNPVAEIAEIRSGTRTWSNLTVNETDNPLGIIRSDAYELRAVVDLSETTATAFGFELGIGADGTGNRTVEYDVAGGRLYGHPLPTDDPSTVEIRLLVDWGQLEVFGNQGRLVVSDNVYFDPNPLDSMRMYAKGGTVKVESLEFHNIRPTWRPAPGVDPGPENLALRKPVRISSSERNDPSSGSFAVDGSLSTRWSSAFRNKARITIDLGQIEDIDRVVLHWETAYSKSYKIRVSNDGKKWTRLYATTTGDGGVDELTDLNGSGRYVQVRSTERGTQWGHSLWEVEVYGPNEG